MDESILFNGLILKKIVFNIKECQTLIRLSEETCQWIRKICRTDKKIRRHINKYQTGVFTIDDIRGWKAISYRRKSVLYHGKVLDLGGKNGVWVKIYAPKKNKNVGKEFCIRYSEIIKKQPHIPT